MYSPVNTLADVRLRRTVAHFVPWLHNLCSILAEHTHSAVYSLAVRHVEDATLVVAAIPVSGLGVEHPFKTPGKMTVNA